MLSGVLRAEYIALFKRQMSRGEQEEVLDGILGKGSWTHVERSKPFTGERSDSISDFAVVKVLFDFVYCCERVK